MKSIDLGEYTIQLIDAGDAARFFTLIDRNRLRIEPFFSNTVARTKTAAETADYVQELIRKAEDRTHLAYLVVDNASGELHGYIDIKNIDWRVPKGELGCFSDDSIAGKGVMKKVFRAFTDRCFSEMGFEKLFLRTHQENRAACAIAEQAGFEVEGRLRKDYRTTGGELVDLLYFGRIQSR